MVFSRVYSENKASARDLAMIKLRSRVGMRIWMYSNSPFKQMPILAGNVHGVVVHTRRSTGVSLSEKAIVIAGSCTV